MPLTGQGRALKSIIILIHTPIHLSSHWSFNQDHKGSIACGRYPGHKYDQDMFVAFKALIMRQHTRTSPAVQWLGLCLPVQRVWVRSPVGELKIPHALRPKSQNIKQKQYRSKFYKDFKKWSTLKKKKVLNKRKCCGSRQKTRAELPYVTLKPRFLMSSSRPLLCSPSMIQILCLSSELFPALALISLEEPPPPITLPFLGPLNSSRLGTKSYCPGSNSSSTFVGSQQ